MTSFRRCTMTSPVELSLGNEKIVFTRKESVSYFFSLNRKKETDLS